MINEIDPRIYNFKNLKLEDQVVVASQFKIFLLVKKEKEDLKEKVSIVLYKNMPVTVTTIYKDDCLVKDDKGNLYTALFEQLMPIK